MKFKDIISNEVLSHYTFVLYVWEETERRFKELHKTKNWCDLTKEEQLCMYCQEYENKLNNGNWVVENES